MISLKYPQGTNTGSLVGTMLPVKLETIYAAWLTVSLTGAVSVLGNSDCISSFTCEEISLPSTGREYIPLATLYWSCFNQLGFLILPDLTKSLISDLVKSVFL